MDISIIIVNYNSADITCQAINSVLKQKNTNYEIIVIDNASQDNSVEKIKQYNTKIRLLENNINVGFGKANNQAFLYATGRYLCLLNPDATFMCRDGLHKLVAYMDACPDYGIVGTHIINGGNNEEIAAQYHYPEVKHVKNRYFDDYPGEIAWVFGAIMCVRTEAYKKINGFDEDYFLYGEDADLCLRIRKAGYKIGYLETVTIHHHGGVSSNDINYYNVRLKKQKGIYIFCKKHYALKEVRRIIQSKKIKSFYRMLSLFMQKLFSKNISTQIKYLRYKAIFVASREFSLSLKNMR